MSFNSLIFLEFFCAVFILYWLVPRQTIQNLVLLIASYVFYGWINPWYAIMLGLSTIADYFLTHGIKRDPIRHRLYTWLSIILNIGVLAFFKYYNFFDTSLAGSIGRLGIQSDFLLLNIVLPLGLSFYTLKKLAYVLDVSRGVLEPTNDFIAYALFISFFPQIISGPIDRAQKLLPQFQQARTWNAENLYSAWPLIVMGFFKKIVVADTMGIIVDRVFGLQQPSKTLLFSAGIGFTLQILADFSGYTDLSRGFALLLGIQTTENFNLPYLSLNPTEFWNRWHITLSTWLRDYIFFPIRRALLKRHVQEWISQSVPPLVTMLICGIWHGTGWTFVIWGLYYGVLIVLYQTIGIRGGWKPSGYIKTFLAWLVMFMLIVFGWILFRSSSLDWLWNIIFHGVWLGDPSESTVILITFSLTLFYATPLLLGYFLKDLPKRHWAVSIYYALLTLGIIIFISSTSPDFIYYQF